MAQTRKSTKKTSTKKKASSTKKRTATSRASNKGGAGARSAKGKSASPEQSVSTTETGGQTSKAPSGKVASKKKAASKKKTASKKAASKKVVSKKVVGKKVVGKKAASKKTTGGKTAARTATKKTTTKKTASKRRAVELPELELVRGLADLVQEYGLEQLKYDSPDVTVTLKRPSPQPLVGDPVVAMAQAPAGASGAVNVPSFGSAPMLIPSPPPPPPPDPDKFLERSGAEADEESHVIKSPFVGTFYRRPSPDAETYVTLGMRIAKGQVLCIIEAMKLMNEIESDVSGRVADILVEDAQPVEYGQPLFKITYS